MVIGTLGGIPGGVAGLWKYNRDNFLYDRGMRQKTRVQGPWIQKIDKRSCGGEDV